jgi:hypothetical protein
VSTGIGAEGIRVTPGQDVVIADTAREYATATVYLLRDTNAGQQPANAGFSTLGRSYDWQRIYPQWDRIYLH